MDKVLLDGKVIRKGIFRVAEKRLDGIKHVLVRNEEINGDSEW